MTNKKEYPKEVIIAAIAGIVILEAIALLKGLNGFLFGIAVAAVAGLAGLVSPQLRTK